MKSRSGIKNSITVIITFIIGQICSAGEIILSPADMEPSASGYYISGADADENKDGVMEHYNGCFDAWENDASHQESGTQQGYTYQNCMIMPTCTSKNTPIDPPVATGFIQLNWSYYLGTDSAKIGAVFTPLISNLTSLTMETSSDCSINPKRTIPYKIEYSKDRGKTWEADYIVDHVATQGGYRVTYKLDGTYPEFDKMINASQSTPILIRISTLDHMISGTETGQYVNIHRMVITGDKVENTGLLKTQNDNLIIEVQGATIISKNGNISVFNQLGQHIGSGKTLNVKNAGIYIIKNRDGATQKVAIK